MVLSWDAGPSGDIVSYSSWDPVEKVIGQGVYYDDQWITLEDESRYSVEVFSTRLSIYREVDLTDEGPLDGAVPLLVVDLSGSDRASIGMFTSGEPYPTDVAWPKDIEAVQR